MREKDETKKHKRVGEEEERVRGVRSFDRNPFAKIFENNKITNY